MAAFLNTCRFNPTAGGTTDWTVASAVTGYKTPATAGAVAGRVYKYRAESANLSQWEEGQGAYSTGVLARTTVLANSSGDTSKINFTTAPQVAIVAMKEDLISIEETNAFTTAQKTQARSNIEAFGTAEVATQANQRAASSIATVVTPGRQQFHPSAAKAWCISDGAATPGVLASYNISSLTDNGVGDTTFNFATAMLSANYAVNASMKTGVTFTSPAATRSIDVILLTAAGVRIATGYWTTSGGGGIDYPIYMSVFGDQ